MTLLLLGAVAAAQTASGPFTDPANLRGERVTPRDGRELPIDQGALGLQQLLRKLGTRASILNIVAHPDDEDGGMMAFYSRGMGARVADLSLTRGEGGQNAMTGDFEDALGLLRTQELLSSDRYAGVDQFFGTEVDFGFSKTKEESFHKWTHERVLYDAVRAVRLYRPLVITSTWIGDVTDGHGQHQVSGQIAQEVFKAAGDPKVFPEMIAEGILPWQPMKVYARVPTQSVSDKGLFDYATGQYIAPRFVNYVTGEASTTPPSVDVVVHEGEPDALLSAAEGKPTSYVQFARMGLAQQKSQIGPGMRPPTAGKFDSSYHRYGSMLPNDRQKDDEQTFFDGIDTSLEGIAKLAPGAFTTDSLSSVSRAVKAASEKLDPFHPEDLAPILAGALRSLDTTIKAVDAWKGDPLKKASALHELRVKRVQLNDALALALGPKLDATAEQADLAKNSMPQIELRATQLADQPGASPQVRSAFGSLNTTIQYNSTYDQHHPPAVLLPVTLVAKMTAPVTEPYFYRDNIEQPVYSLRDPSLRNAPATPAPLVAWNRYRYNDVDFEVGAVLHAGPQPVEIVPAATSAVTYRAVGYGDLPRTNYYPLAPKHVSTANLRLPTRRRIAYLPGTGDAVPEALASIGLKPEMLTVADLTAAKLAQFDTVILGVRTYAAHHDLHGAPTQALLEFARSGGNVVVQYQTLEFTAEDAPYPITPAASVPQGTVVDESAPVQLLEPSNPLLTAPNRITPADFNGWIAERGHGFLRSWDAHYTALTETHDPGAAAEGVLPQEPQRGGLITTPLGDDPNHMGRWTYVAYALYRQLPEAVPGAYRLFVNLLGP